MVVMILFVAVGAGLTLTVQTVLVDEAGVARSHREAPEIDGIVQVPEHLAVGSLVKVRVTDALGPDLVAEAV